MSVDRVLRQNFWVVLLALLALIAFASARGVSAVAKMWVGPDAKELSAPPLLAKSLPAAQAGVHGSNADSILARNPFDSTQGPLSRPKLVEEPPEEVATGPDLSDPMNSPACDGVKLLVVIASTDPDWSFASFQVGADKNVLRRRGEDVSGKNVEFIGWDRAFLSTGKGLCQAQLFKPGPPPEVRFRHAGSGRQRRPGRARPRSRERDPQGRRERVGHRSQRGRQDSREPGRIDEDCTHHPRQGRGQGQRRSPLRHQERLAPVAARHGER